MKIVAWREQTLGCIAYIITLQTCLEHKSEIS